MTSLRNSPLPGTPLVNEPGTEKQRGSRTAGHFPWYGLGFSLPMLVWQLAFFVFPLAFLVTISFWVVRNFRMVPAFEWQNWHYILSRGFFWEAYAHTLGMAAGAALLVSLVAFPCAYAIAFKFRASARQLMMLLLITPFFTSYLVRTYSWQVFLSDNGILNALLGQVGIGALPMLNSAFGTYVGYFTLCLPLVVLLQLLSLMYIDRSLVEAAHNLGCGRLRTVLQVVVPAARIGIVVGALFCFILSFGDFVSPLYLGGGQPPTLSTLIADTTKSGQQWPRAAVIATMMIVTLLLVALGAVRFAYRRRA
ncbi:ABC transporter permease [Pseudomonas panipatensis]|uniref:Spermidine/putrescine transport system permease protein/putrescine transport system permease protein n=1 Tax=Pseudomonas panipatensis TaxID=428992 RepID=A0A1G8M224_9PSED|nr:ABC transporter permease [Pseudomonas panipatensis]SDI61460.1 spermidine/putrescine transport system permease protein/putrescine transport system permease protein [Pseudomonas panipatensis]SMP48377.1 spermidine/putrescine transport system permease protein/putrescine transport system permease protein [Pseudomonas panipatensis]